MLSLTFKKPAAVKGQNSIILVSFTADVLSGAESLFSSSSLRNH